MANIDLVGRLFSMVRNRDGQAHALEPLALRRVQAPEPDRREIPDPERCVQQAIATKLLEGWLANRHQTLVPHTLNFQALSPDEASLLLSVMAAAAQADGQIDEREARQIPLALKRVGAGDAEAAQLIEALGQPQSLAGLLERVTEAGLAAYAYAAALLAINRRSRVNQAFLHYLALRLALPHDVWADLERRYRI